MSKPDLSIIIVTYNSQRFISGCLDSLLKSNLVYEIFVVDNYSTDNTVPIVQEYQKNNGTIFLITLKKNFGYAFGNNVGLTLSQGRAVLFLNPDTIVLENSLEELSACLFSSNEIGLAAPQLLNFDCSIQPSCRSFFEPIFILYDIMGLSRVFSKNKWFGKWRMGYFDHQSIKFVDQPMGAALMVKKTVLDKIGGFDEKFNMFFNDVDLCKRIQKTYKIVFYPKSRIKHYKGHSIYPNRIKMLFWSHWNMTNYIFKYNGVLKAAIWGILVFNIFLLRSAWVLIRRLFPYPLNSN